ncbi:hypothetical protein COHA_002877 [Chlorella ohadii]|uniref:Uncharacterized protein n=1 Tax=Chlorella ohadii TaxID=2649997 RepID=A0AAD5DW45_9CHLO|nr:hypothetical protein COHA_002877 [Chlorella ohadii]
MKALHLAILLACCAAASAASSRALNWGNDKCHLDNYVCVDSHNFCLGNTVMRCADGTRCKTQPKSRRADVSPCISGSSTSSSSSHKPKPKPQEKPSKCGKECGKTKTDYRHADCEGKSGCHKTTSKRCHKANYHCVDGRNFCLGNKVMRCAKGTVCKTWPYLKWGISPCVWP